MRGCGGNQPRVNGTAVIGPSQGGVFFFDFAANSSGVVSGTLYSTRDATGLLGGDIECGGVKTSVWYGMQIFVAGKGGPEVAVHALNTATLDISNVTPITTNPVVTAPTGDSTYFRKDAGNSPITGPTQINSSLTVSGTGTLANLNNVIFCDQQAGATADIKIAACIAALPAAGGTADARGFGATTQTIASTVLVQKASGSLTLLLDPSTKFVAGTTSTDMFSVGVGTIPSVTVIDGLTVDNTSLSTYSGNVVKFGIASSCADSQRCVLRNFNIKNGTKGSPILTGNAVLLQAPNAGNVLSWVFVQDGFITGFNNGVFLNALGAIGGGSGGFVSGNWIINVVVDGAQTCFNVTSNPGDNLGNKFMNSDCQFQGSVAGEKGIFTSGTAGVNLYGNVFNHVNLWDYSGGQTAITWDANSSKNTFIGLSVNTGGTDLVDNSTAATNNVINWFANASGNDFPQFNTSGNFIISSTGNGKGLKLKGGDTQWNIQPHTTSTGDLCFTQSGAATVFCSQHGNGIYPFSAASEPLGQAANPWSKLYLGTTATNNFVLTPAATTQAIAVGLPDPGVAAMKNALSYNATIGYYVSKRATAGCTTAASIGGVCATPITVTWGVTLPNTNYSVVCTPNGAATNLPSNPYWTAKTTTTATINYFAITAAAASWVSVDCMAILD